MAKQKLERLFARIKLIRQYDNGELGDPFEYIYNREHFDELGIPINHNAQFLEIGHKFEYENQKYEIVNMNFKMKDVINFKGIEHYDESEENKYEQSEFNCSINLFVKEIN